MPARAAADARKNEAIAAQLAAERARREGAQRGKFASLTPESPFADHLDYLNANLPEPEHEKAVAQARRSATRQEAAVALLQEEKLRCSRCASCGVSMSPRRPNYAAQ